MLRGKSATPLALLCSALLMLCGGWLPNAGGAGGTISSTGSLLRRLNLPADYADKLTTCSLDGAAVATASMAQLMGCGMKVGHARRLLKELQSTANNKAGGAAASPKKKAAPPPPSPPPPTKAARCGSYSSCDICTANSKCGWCIAAGKCVDDQQGFCVGPDDHVSAFTTDANERAPPLPPPPQLDIQGKYMSDSLLAVSHIGWFSRHGGRLSVY